MNLEDKLAAAAEILGTSFSKPALALFVSRLSAYSPDAISKALDRCLDEHQGRLTVQAIVSRIDDGRPGPEEAWAMCPIKSSDSVIWTEEMETAFLVALPHILLSDRVAARMAFVEKYRSEVMKNRSDGARPAWKVGIGTSNLKRVEAIKMAAEKGITGAEGNKLLELQEGGGTEGATENPINSIKPDAWAVRLCAVERSNSSEPEWLKGAR